MDTFLGHFRERSKVEQTWLSDLFCNVRDRLLPMLSGELLVDETAFAVVSRLKDCFSSDSLPLSFRCVCVSELLSKQRSACFSSLTMSTSQYREEALEAEQALPNHKALPRANLLLIGCLTAGAEGWRLSDSSGSVHCELLYPKPSWINQPMLFPSWNYIAHNASGKVGQEAGYLEIIATPILLSADAVTSSPGVSGVGVKRAALRLKEKRPGGELVCVSGEVCAVSPLLLIGGKRFFSFRLRERSYTVPILVMDSRFMFWQPCLLVGSRVSVSALRVCSLQGRVGHRVLSVTPQSRLLALDPSNHQSGTAASADETVTDHSIGHSLQGGTGMQMLPVNMHLSDAEEQLTVAKETSTTQGEECLSASTDTHAVCAVKVKQSKVISYKGVITAVTDQEAGLYVIDGKVGLCLAYQPLRWNSGLRPGAEVELQHVHFVFRPSPHSLPTMLCACLHSSVRVTSFSRVVPGSSAPTVSHGALPRLLLERNLGVSEYLWLYHYSTALQQRLSPRWVCEARVYVVACRLLECVCVRQQEREPRDIYREMWQEPHLCPLSQYRVCGVGCKVPSISELCDWLTEECWSSLSLSSLLPVSAAASLTQAELNPLLSWSFRSWAVQEEPRLALLVGILEASGSTATLQLRDQTGALDCVLVDTHAQSDRQHPADNTAWLGCLVCVRRCTLVAERFLKSNFPSWKHLDEQKYIIRKHCRVYVQVCVKDLHILSSSSAMTRLLAERENEGQEGKTTNEQKRTESVSGGKEGVRKKMAAEEGTPGARCGRREAGEKNPNEARASENNGKRKGKRRREDEEEEEEEREGAAVESEKSGVSSKRRRTGEQVSSASPAEQGLMGRVLEDPSSDPCVSLVVRVESKQSVALRNHQLSSRTTPGLSLSFVATVTCLGRAQGWETDPRNSPLLERECDAPSTQLDLQFISSAVRWFPLLHSGSVYRLIALHTQDVGVLSVKTEGVKGNPTLIVQPRWRIHTLVNTLTTRITPSEAQTVRTVSQVLQHCSCPEIVSFYGVIAQRITLEEDPGKTPVLQSLIKDKDVCVDTNLKFRLTVEDAETAAQSIQVYVDLSHNPFLPGLISGAAVLFHSCQRLVSRKGNVYCRFLPISCVTVTGLGSEMPNSEQQRLPPPQMFLGEWAHEQEGQRCMLGRLKVHVTCVLHLKMQWTCSLCGSIYKQSGCSRTAPPCDSSSAVFQAEAKVAVEDGTGEAHIWFSTDLLPGLLLLGATEWEGLQLRLRVRGLLRVYARGRDMVSDINPEDPLVRYLCALCSSSSVCQELTLTCQLRSQRQEAPQLRRMKRGEREFLSKFPSPLQLTCTHIV